MDPDFKKKKFFFTNDNYYRKCKNVNKSGKKGKKS